MLLRAHLQKGALVWGRSLCRLCASAPAFRNRVARNPAAAAAKNNATGWLRAKDWTWRTKPSRSLLRRGGRHALQAVGRPFDDVRGRRVAVAGFVRGLAQRAR